VKPRQGRLWGASLRGRLFYHVCLGRPRRVLTQALCRPQGADRGLPPPRTLPAGRRRLIPGFRCGRSREPQRPLRGSHQRRLPLALALATLQLTPQPNQLLLRPRPRRPLGARHAGRHQSLQRAPLQQVIMHRRHAQGASCRRGRLFPGQDFQDGRRPSLGRSRRVPAQIRIRRGPLAAVGDRAANRPTCLGRRT
jgi:hypothetical protein